jgi:hypothetical protein
VYCVFDKCTNDCAFCMRPSNCRTASTAGSMGNDLSCVDTSEGMAAVNLYKYWLLSGSHLVSVNVTQVEASCVATTHLYLYLGSRYHEWSSTRVVETA